MANRTVTKGNVRFVFNSAGFQQILESPKVRADISARTRAIASAAGEGMEGTVFTARFGGSPRPVGVVSTKTLKARAAEATGKALTRAIDAGR
jgi:hypothetical protein